MQKHKESRERWIEIAHTANLLLRERDFDPQELKNFAGINYFAARRILLDGIKSQTDNARSVCIKLGLIQESEKVQKLGLDDIYQVLKECWGGDSAQAELLIKLIQSTTNLKIQYIET